MCHSRIRTARPSKGQNGYIVTIVLCVLWYIMGWLLCITIPPSDICLYNAKIRGNNMSIVEKIWSSGRMTYDHYACHVDRNFPQWIYYCHRFLLFLVMCATVSWLVVFVVDLIFENGYIVVIDIGYFWSCVCWFTGRCMHVAFSLTHFFVGKGIVRRNPIRPGSTNYLAIQMC